jgi:CheY-like chemotaxis protein
MKPVHILLVEDNEGDILLTTEALNEGKIANTVSVVRDGWEAIQFLEKREKYIDVEDPDIILMDVNLPKMNGHEVVKYIKSSDHLRHIPVIMLTTSTSSNDILLSYRNHVNCFITKPVEVNDFLNVISSLENFWITIVQLPNRVLA